MSDATPFIPIAPTGVQDGSMLWMRQWKLSVGTPQGDVAQDLSAYAFEFSVEGAQLQTPWIAHITIYNIDVSVVARLQTELTHIYLEAGYSPPSQQYGILFQGEIAYFKYGRKNATDTFIEIVAMQADQPINRAVVNQGLAKGAVIKDAVNAAIDAMAPWGITMGQITDLPANQSPRGRTLFGMASDILRDIAQTNNAYWFVDNQGQLHILKEGEYLAMGSETVPILNQNTGMIDVPTQELGGGISVRSLLNPKIAPGGQIHLDMTSIGGNLQLANGVSYTTVNPDLLPDTAYALAATAPLKADGFYVVASIRHWGMNRGNPWYSDIVTMPLDPSKLAITPRTSA